MDPIKIEKLQAMKRYQKIQFLQVLFQYSLTAIVLINCLSKISWLPTSLFSSLKLFFTVSLPNIGTFLINPKCLFVVCNIIVVFLVGESKLKSPAFTSPDMYDEYVNHSQSLRRQPLAEKKEKERRMEDCLNEGGEEMIKQVIVEEEGEEAKEEKEEKGGQNLIGADEEEEKEEKGVEEEEEEKNEMAVAELNKRIEDFIARVNKRRMLEAKMLLCSG